MGIFNQEQFSDEKLKLLLSGLEKIEIIYHFKTQIIPTNLLKPHFKWVSIYNCNSLKVIT